MYGEDTKQTILGHSCQGGGAKIENSPINIHFHFHAESISTINKIRRAINGVIGQRTIDIENTNQLSENELPKPKVVAEYTSWTINEYKIILTDGRWYCFDYNMGRAENIVIRSFHSGVIDSYRYKKILGILKRSADYHRE